MGLRELAELDLALTLEDAVNGFGFSITVTDLSGVSADFTGQSSDIRFFIDPETGQGVASNKAHVALRKSTLEASALTIPNSGMLKGFKIDFKSINGFAYKYVVQETWPDKTLGMITCLLGSLTVGS